MYFLRLSILPITISSALIVFLNFLNPNSLHSQTFTDSLDVCGFWEIAKDTAATCKTDWEEISSELAIMEKAIKDNDKNTIDVKKLGKAYAKAQNIVRDATILVELGEPTGIDFSYRGKTATTLIEKAVNHMKGTPEATKIMGQADGYKTKSDSKRSKMIQSLDRLISSSEFDKAEKELRVLQTDVDTFVLWLAPRDVQPILQQFSEQARNINSAMSKIRTKRTNELINEAVRNQQLQLDVLTQVSATAAAEIQSKGSTDIGGQQCDGPTAFAKICEEWQIIHQKMTCCIGMEYCASNARLDIPAKELFGQNSSSTNWTDAGYELHASLTANLPKLIEADATQTTAADLPQKYAQYVQTLGVISNQLSDKSFVTQCEKALATFAKKDPAFATRVDNYRKATDDILLWRNRVAVAAAKNLNKTYLPPSELLGTQPFIPQLKNGLNEVVPKLAENVGKKTMLPRVFGIAETASFAGCSNRVWASIKSPLFQQAEIDSLARDLFVSETQSPLTVAAAGAITTAQNNCFDSIGGSVQNVHAESMATRLGKLSPRMTMLFPIGELPKETAGLSDMMIRLEIDPDWIQHKYFFVKLK